MEILARCVSHSSRLCVADVADEKDCTICVCSSVPDDEGKKA